MTRRAGRAARDRYWAGRLLLAADAGAVPGAETALMKLTPVQVLERLLIRLEKRMEALQRVKLDGFQMVISELEMELDYLRPQSRAPVVKPVF